MSRSHPLAAHSRRCEYSLHAFFQTIVKLCQRVTVVIIILLHLWPGRNKEARGPEERSIDHCDCRLLPDGSIRCQHGPDECTLNRLETCLLNFVPAKVRLDPRDRNPLPQLVPHASFGGACGAKNPKLLDPQEAMLALKCIESSILPPTKIAGRCIIHHVAEGARV